MFWFMNDWGQYGRAYEKIAENLAKLPEVSTVICFFPPIRTASTRWPTQTIKVENVNPKLSVITLSDVIRPGNRPFREARRVVNDKVSGFFLARFLKTLGLKKENTVLWLYPPHRFIDAVLTRIPYTVLVTQIIDNSAFMTNKGEKYKHFSHEQYRRLAKLSDAVITSSQFNYDIFSKYNTHCGLFENAVDSIFITEPSDLPHRVTKGRPRLGYVGFVTQRTDLKLLEYIAQQRPNYDLIIAGPMSAEQNIDNLVRLPNVSYIGAIPYNEVPGFIQALDVCLLAHKDTQYSRAMSPLKLYQYLGAGRPIVSTRVAGVERFDGLVSIAETYSDFVACIDKNIQDDDESLQQKRIQVAKHDNWGKRTRDILEYVVNSAPPVAASKNTKSTITSCPT